jgi:hypothetical protein
MNLTESINKFRTEIPMITVVEEEEVFNDWRDPFIEFRTRRRHIVRAIRAHELHWITKPKNKSIHEPAL